jgi:AcrR family transcriptional regulator
MKVTKEKATENRAALLRAASRLFQERGIDGVGVAEISKKAGLTHGALYAQFPSKEALAAEAFTSEILMYAAPRCRYGCKMRVDERQFPPIGRLIPAPWLGRDAMLRGSRRQNGERAS